MFENKVKINYLSFQSKYYKLNKKLQINIKEGLPKSKKAFIH